MCCNSWRMTGLLESGLKVRPLVLPDAFIDQAKPEKMYADAGLDAAGIVRTCLPRWAAGARRSRLTAASLHSVQAFAKEGR